MTTTDTRPESAPGDAVAGDDAGDRVDHDVTGERPRWRRIASWVITGLALVFVLVTLIVPTLVSQLTLGAFVRIPVEGLVGVALVLVLPARARRVVAVVVGVALALLALLKVFDLGFYEILARPFDPVLDWTSVRAAVEYLSVTSGRTSAIVAVILAGLLAVAVLVLMPLAVLRLTRVAVAHRTGTARGVAVLGVAWVACALAGVQLVAGVPVASTSASAVAYAHASQVHSSLNDQHEFAEQAAVDAFRDTPGDQLLTALHGKDVVLTFIESYGRDAIEDPEYATQVNAVLDAGTNRLRAAGLSARSGFLTSSTVGGNSWLAHATLLSGLWIDNQQRYRTLVASDRLTLNKAFQRADWRTVGVMPGVTRAWPEGEFFGYDKIYAGADLGYRGPRFSYANMPDQYTISAFQRAERTPGHAPVMAELALLSSHVPWAPIPQLVDWNDVGDGTIFNPMGGDSPPPGRDSTQERADYRRSIEYSLSTLISYAETHGDDDLVLVFLGDHQPAPLITGDNASRDVPITIVARDPAVLDRISDWGWQDGLKPGPQAPVWPMSAFRDRFLTAFGPQSTHSPAR